VLAERIQKRPGTDVYLGGSCIKCVLDSATFPFGSAPAIAVSGADPIGRSVLAHAPI
jgi:hypothetical protein